MSKSKLMLALAITMVAEGMITVNLIWSGAQAGQSPLVLGIVLFVMNIVPFVAQKCVPPLASQISARPLRTLVRVRLLGVPVALAGYFIIPDNAGGSLILIAAGLAFVTFISQQALETYMGQLTVAGRLDAGSAARLSQAALQGGVFAGNAAAGVVIATVGTPYVYVLIGLLFLTSIGLTGFRDTDDVQPRSTEQAPSSPLGGSGRVGWMLVACMSLLAIQMMGFNYFVPVIFESRPALTAAHYGFVSAAAGIGALLATTIAMQNSALVIAMAMVVVVSNAILGHSTHIALWLTSGFMIGFGFNLARVRVRQLLFETLRDRSDAAVWGGRITIGFRSTAALAPLGFGALMAAGPSPSPAFYFAVVGAIVMGFLVPILLVNVERITAVRMLRS